ncbi:MAG: helix-turn-helix domain-containing protein [Balneolaceae bacterium]|nr:MAG: helix-turn-helix domain-containing protein [Balneolaceae bacterium]
MKLYVRYMVSLRCKMIVRDELKKLEIKHSILPYGAIEFLDEITQKELNTLRRNLRKSGLDLLDVRESKLVERIINTIIEVIHYFDELPKLTYSEIISKNVDEANESVLKIFSEVVGMSLIQFIVTQKVERVKEILLYEDMSLPEISYILHYKSEQHLIAQFKKYTGLTPAFFSDLKKERQNIASRNSQN